MVKPFIYLGVFAACFFMLLIVTDARFPSSSDWKWGGFTLSALLVLGVCAVYDYLSRRGPRPPDEPFGFL